MRRKIFLIIVAILIVIQFIRPTKNISTVVSPNDISNHYPVPDDVKKILEVACNDCHTNNTKYPWYTNIQPIGWWMQWHVNEGKEHLNFSEFVAYTPKRQHHKMEETVEQVKSGEMPLKSYLWIHADAKLSQEEKERLVNWAGQLRDTLAKRYNIQPETER